MIANPFAVFLMRQFVLALPRELERRARRRRRPLAHLLEHRAAEPQARARGAQHHHRARRLERLPVPAGAAEHPDLFTVPLLLTRSRGSSVRSLRAGDGRLGDRDRAMLIVFVIGQRKILNSMAASGLGGR
ncbi:hypothetical protein [Microbacterium sp. Y-01]|uniref:hypothetical protein n=1 Tax=Microbacterium sp. Y-01 TaxID=2048898 RepID=UPI001F14DBA1|nr:hypothetical protein [Microbacterium sp. Y-01]